MIVKVIVLSLFYVLLTTMAAPPLVKSPVEPYVENNITDSDEDIIITEIPCLKNTTENDFDCFNSTDVSTENDDDDDTSTEKPCIRDYHGNCFNISTAIDRTIFDIQVDTDCPKNETRNVHGDCVDSGSVLIFPEFD